MGQKRLTNTNHYGQWPDFLKRASDTSFIRSSDLFRPVVLEMGLAESEKSLRDLLSNVKVGQIFDNYDEQLAELYTSENAQLYKASSEVKSSSIKDHLSNHYDGQPAWAKGSWVYYPWNGRLVHILGRELFTRLLTIRNQFLIEADEQEQYRNYRVGCAGMSVGSNGAVAIAMTGGSQSLKLADGAVLSGTNLNRVRSGVAEIGQNKAIVISRQIAEINPYMDLDVTSSNLSQEGLNNFFTEPWPLDLVIDEVDEIEMKIRLRIEAKKRRLPVIMVTEPGDDIMLDVERYDLNPNLPIFHGLAGDLEDAFSKKTITQREFVKYAIMIIGVRNLPIRAQKAMLKVGATIPSPPQLGSTAMMAGGVIAFAARQLATGGKLKSGRHTISLEQELTKNSSSVKHRINHYKSSQSLKRASRLM